MPRLTGYAGAFSKSPGDEEAVHLRYFAPRILLGDRFIAISCRPVVRRLVYHHGGAVFSRVGV